MINLKSKLPSVGTSIFTLMSQLANEHAAINLSQGFPDFDCSPDLIELVNHYMKEGKNQYAPMAGLMALREMIAAKVNSAHHSAYNPETEVTITAGGTQALYTAIAAVIHPGDEVIIFEPAYDAYAPAVQLSGGVVRPYRLHPPDYRADWSKVREMVNSRTRMIIINSPHNPTGTLLDENDIVQLVDLTKNTDIIILSDEVYEHLVFDGRQHLSMARFSELRERCFIVASFGKLFHTTGWKAGYCIAPKNLMTEFRKAHQFMVFSVNTPVQYALASFMRNPSHYQGLNQFFQEKRDFLVKLMKDTRFQLLPCDGSYFLSVSYRDFSNAKDVDFARHLIEKFKVATIPVSAFYSDGVDHRILRLCFAKKNDTLEKAVEKLIQV